MKKVFINDLKVGDKVEDIFFLRECRRQRRNVDYLRLELQDKTGVINGLLFENLEKAVGIKDLIFVRINGSVREYEGKRNIIISEIVEVRPEEVRKEDFIIRSKYDSDSLLRVVKDYAERIENPFLAKLVQAFLSDDQFVRAFKEAPAAKKIHQAYIGGLLEHTVNLLRIVDGIKEVYPEEFDLSLLIAGAILHDIGKIIEYEYDVSISISTRGNLIGHIVLGYEMVKEKIKEIKDFPEDLANRIYHLILSHHGEMSPHSPVLPKTPEAILLHHLDYLDADLAKVREAIEKAKSEGREEWTNYDWRLKTEIYYG